MPVGNYSDEPSETIRIIYKKGLVYCLRENSPHMRKGIIFKTHVDIYGFNSCCIHETLEKLSTQLETQFICYRVYGDESWTNDEQVKLMRMHGKEKKFSDHLLKRWLELK